MKTGTKAGSRSGMGLGVECLIADLLQQIRGIVENEAKSDFSCLLNGLAKLLDESFSNCNSRSICK